MAAARSGYRAFSRARAAPPSTTAALTPLAQNPPWQWQGTRFFACVYAWRAATWAAQKRGKSPYRVYIRLGALCLQLPLRSTQGKGRTTHPGGDSPSTSAAHTALAHQAKPCPAQRKTRPAYAKARSFIYTFPPVPHPPPVASHIPVWTRARSAHKAESAGSARERQRTNPPA